AAKEKAKRSTCQNHLKQIGMGLTMYAGDFADRVPPCSWAENATAGNDATYDAYNGSLNANSATNLGLLWVAKTISDARIFYCLSGTTAKGIGTTGFYASERTYENYSGAGTPTVGWPQFYPGDANQRVRLGYTYFPQSGKSTLQARSIPTKP